MYMCMYMYVFVFVFMHLTRDADGCSPNLDLAAVPASFRIVLLSAFTFIERCGWTKRCVLPVVQPPVMAGTQLHVPCLCNFRVTTSPGRAKLTGFGKVDRVGLS